MWWGILRRYTLIFVSCFLVLCVFDMVFFVIWVLTARQVFARIHLVRYCKDWDMTGISRQNTCVQLAALALEVANIQTIGPLLIPGLRCSKTSSMVMAR